MTVRTVAVAGLGLIGGSLARTLVRSGVEVVAFDPDARTREDAAALGIRVVDDAAALGGADPDVLVLATPLAVLGDVARRVARTLPDRTTVTDVGSVKAAVRAAVESAGLGDRYVGAHPMAGTEASGFAASSADLLVGAPWAVTVAPATDPERLLVVLALVAGPLGGRPRVVGDDAHDAAVALVSHVPHVLATELLNVVARASGRGLALGLAAGSFRDGTRVARTDPRRTQAMVTGNGAAVAAVVRAAAADLAALADALDAGAGRATDGPVDAFFAQADPVRALLAGAASATSGEAPGAADVEVVALDGPGWQARLAALGEAGGVVVGLDMGARTVTVGAAAS